MTLRLFFLAMVSRLNKAMFTSFLSIFPLKKSMKSYLSSSASLPSYSTLLLQDLFDLFSPFDLIDFLLLASVDIGHVAITHTFIPLIIV